MIGDEEEGSYVLDLSTEVRATVDAEGAGTIWFGDEPMASFNWLHGQIIGNLRPELPVEMVVGFETALWAQQQELKKG